MRIASILAAAGLAAALMGSSPVAADGYGPPGGPEEGQCFEGVGCTYNHFFTPRSLRGLSCQNLRHLRNAIYRGRLYCFRSRAMLEDQVGSGPGADAWLSRCRFRDADAIPFNRFERYNISAVLRAERSLRCPM